MINAWLIYDPIENKPISVSWKKIGNNCFEISKDDAIDFLEGKAVFNDFCIFELNDKKTLQKKENVFDQSVKFWGLNTLNENNSDVVIVFDTDGLIVNISSSDATYHLYACLKDDPSWLIKSWILDSHIVNQGTAKIVFQNSSNYSYYLRKL